MRGGRLWPRAAAAWVLALMWSGQAAVAQAAPLCESAIFQCEDGDGVTHGKNLVVLVMEEKRDLKWVMRKCGAPLDRHPYQCDWKKTIRGRRLAGARPAATESPAEAPRTEPAREAAPKSAPIADRVRPAPSTRGQDGPTAQGGTPWAETSAEDTVPYAEEVRAAAERYRIPADLVRAVMKTESGFNPGAVSIKGAVGLMQLMPDTARAMGVGDLRDPAQNIMGGTRFLRVLANRFKGDLVKVLSAYHAGSTRVKDRGGTPFASTDGYVRKVLGTYYALRDK